VLASVKRLAEGQCKKRQEPAFKKNNLCKKNYASSSTGMTLIEILVAMAILSVLTYYISTTIQNGAKTKVKVETEIQTYSTLRDALRIMEADMNRAFNYRDINIKLYNEAMKEREKRLKEAQAKTNEGNTASNNTPKTVTQLEPFEPRVERVVTAFWGDSDEVHFTSLNNIQTIADKKESNQMEVGYYLEECRGRLNKKKQSKCLWRRTSPILDDDVKDGGEKTVLLENVKTFKLRYLGPPEGDTVEWDAGWQSDGNLSAKTKDQFPMAVEITLEVQDESKENAKPVAMTMVAQIRNPNNPKPEATGDENENAEKSPTTTK
ncbi:MAG: prepilin-type N-terminal cleavage/methylation domain-containing protein, partial [Bdellovibrionales bacterium]|nr:prepilin-type N-terminal cleavage/methylation domain-containing protein [Bdellovibrionales bacterium]